LVRKWISRGEYKEENTKRRIQRGEYKEENTKRRIQRGEYKEDLLSKHFFACRNGVAASL
jgi:hypothetical protein